MNTLNVKIALWVIALGIILLLAKEIFLQENRFEISAASSTVYRLDKKTGEVEAFVMDPREKGMIPYKEYWEKRFK